MKQLYFLAILMLTLPLTAQITQVKDINPGSENSNPQLKAVFGGKIYLSADDSSGTNTGGTDIGRELWSSDGTDAGTTFVKDIRSGSSGSSPNFFFELNGELFFLANDGNGLAQIWKTDGTDAGTVNTNNGFSIVNPIVVGSKAYMTASTNGNTFYEFTGTTSQQVPDVGSGIAYPTAGRYIAYDNNTIFLYMDYSTDEPTIGRELYKYDITTQTYTLIKDINTGTGDSSISNFTKIGTKVYFEAENALWETDGTGAGTIKVDVVDGGGIVDVMHFYAWNGKLYFEGDAGSNDQLYVFDPVADTVTNLSNTSGYDHNPIHFVEYNGYLYYAGDDAANTSDNLFRTNGTTIEQVDTAIERVDDLVVFNNKIYFEGNDGTTGNELYVLEPTVLSIATVTFDKSLNIYPNPSINFINVRGDFQEEVSYEIYSIIGKKVQAGNVLNNRIDFNLTSGMYILKITSGTSSATRKIVVE